jgi:hypothetical protein
MQRCKMRQMSNSATLGVSTKSTTPHAQKCCKTNKNRHLRIIATKTLIVARGVHLLQGSRGGKRWPALAAEAN